MFKATENRLIEAQSVLDKYDTLLRTRATIDVPAFKAELQAVLVCGSSDIIEFIGDLGKQHKYGALVEYWKVNAW